MNQISVTRFPREQFTNALIRLCERLDASFSREFELGANRNSRFDPLSKVRGEVKALWAYGSWAQGLSECGDLDLAASIRIEWAQIPTRSGEAMHDYPIGPPPVNFSVVRPKLFRVGSNVNVTDWKDIALGVSTVSPTDCIQVWQSPNGHQVFDWREAVARVKENPLARRKPRLSDAFPFSTLRVGQDLRAMSIAMLAALRGQLRWHFVPHDAMKIGNFRANEYTIRRKVKVLTQVQVPEGADPLYLFGGECSISINLLRDDSECFVLTPRYSTQGPNGSVVVCKGPSWSEAAAREWNHLSDKELAAQVEVAEKQLHEGRSD